MNPASLPESVRTPTLSICVPTYNRARYLECLLEDLSAHVNDLGHSCELLIGDNASEDHTADIVERYKERLAIRYFRRPKNLGAYRNRDLLVSAAHGRYVVYVADADLLLLKQLGRYVDYLEANPDIGAVFAPWFLHDRVVGADFDRFYSVAETTRIAASNQLALFNFLVNGHIFPEICLVRTSLAREVASDPNQFAFYFFVQISAMVDRVAVAFCPEPFYRQVIRYFDDETRVQGGHEETKTGWDRYRGGLEFVLAKFVHQLDAENLAWCHRAIEHFANVRMHVALRLRTLHGTDWVDNYYIANRLRCVGDDSLLSAPYETYRINAAWEYLTGLQPFYPEPAIVGYYLDDPPRLLAQAHGFSTDGMMAKADRSVPFPDNVILLTSREPAAPGSAKVAVSEDELLAKFP